MEINAQHKAVARMLAMGFPLREICAVYRMELARWSSVVGQPLFQQEVARIQQELEQRMLDDASSDPIMLELRQGAQRAASRLVKEIDNAGEDSNASSRIKAATTLLDRLGYTSKKDDQAQQVVFVSLTQDKVDAVMGKKVLAEQPESIQG